MIRVLQINAVYGQGSTGRIMRDIYETSLEGGIDALVAYQKSCCAPEGAYRIGTPLDWKLHAVLTRLTGKQGYFSKRATKRLIAYIKEKRPDVIHLHNLHANYVNLPMLLRCCKDNGIAVMLTLHDSWFFTGKCFHFADIDCNKYITGCSSCPKKRVDIPNLGRDNSARVWADRVKLFSDIERLTVVGCSRWMSDNAAKFPGFKNARITSIYNGVDTGVFAPRSSARERLGLAGFVILGMANKWLIPENKDVFLGVVDSLGPQDTLLLVGCTPEEAESLKKYENKNVRAIGFVSDREELADIYAASDVFVNLSLIDTLPTVDMESICCGTPVITYNVGGGPELVYEGKSGYVVPLLDGTAVLAAIDKVRRGDIDREACARIGKENFDKEKNYGKYVEEYSRLL